MNSSSTPRIECRRHIGVVSPSLQEERSEYILNSVGVHTGYWHNSIDPIEYFVLQDEDRETFAEDYKHDLKNM